MTDNKENIIAFFQQRHFCSQSYQIPSFNSNDGNFVSAVNFNVKNYKIHAVNKVKWSHRHDFLFLGNGNTFGELTNKVINMKSSRYNLIS